MFSTERSTARSTASEPERTLVTRAVNGDLSAFDELYRRHVHAAMRAAQAVVSSPDDAADAVAEAFTKLMRGIREGSVGHIHNFRAYLLTATRHAAVDRRRRSEQAGREARRSVDQAVGAPEEFVADAADGACIMRAFEGLPERWQHVLWLMEIEGKRPGDVAVEMGMTPNAVSQLAFRARARLRQRYVEAHVRKPPAGPCQDVSGRLSSYVLGTLSASQSERVTRHLEACDRCRRQYDELRMVAPRA